MLGTAAYYGTALLYPILTGPLAGYVLLKACRGKHRTWGLLFWPALILLHAAGYAVMRRTLGDLLIGPGAMSCMITPLFAVVTALGMVVAWRRLRQAQDGEPVCGRQLVAGAVLIPLMQLVTVFVLALLAPARP